MVFSSVYKLLSQSLSPHREALSSSIINLSVTGSYSSPFVTAHESANK